MHLCSSDCSFCAGPPKTTFHVLHDCPRAMVIWMHLVNVVLALINTKKKSVNYGA